MAEGETKSTDSSSSNLLHITWKKRRRALLLIDILWIFAYLICLLLIINLGDLKPFGLSKSIGENVKVVERGLVHSITKPSISLLDPLFCHWVEELAESYPEHPYSSRLSSTEEERVTFGDWFTQQIETLNIESQEDSGVAHCETKGRKGRGKGEGFCGPAWWGVLRAPRTSTVESVALVVNAKQPFGVAFGLALLRHLKDSPWLSKDVILLAWWPTNTTEAHEDSRIYSSLESWLREYHEERPFAGIIRAALCLSLPSLSKFNIKGETLLAFRRTVLSLEGANGQLPNLDLPALFVDRLGRRDKSRVSLHPSDHPTLNFFRAWTKSSPRSSLLTFMFNLAKGIPTGAHGLFNQYRIDALTLTPEYFVLRHVDNSAHLSRPLPISVLGGAVETVLHTLSNLMEPLIMNNFYYLLPDPYHFIGSSQYFIPFIVIIIRVPLKMATFEGMDKTTSLLPASSIMALGLFAFFLPDILPSSSFLSFLTASEQWLLIVSTLSFLVLLFVLNHKSRLLRGGWTGLDVTGSMSLTLFLISFSFLNFSFVLLASFIFVPLCSYLTPTLLGPSLTKSNEEKRKGQEMELEEGKLGVKEKILTLFKLFLTVLVSPLVLFSLASFFTGVKASELVDLVINQYQHYSTLAFPFLCLVYLPWSLTTFASLWYSLK